MILHNNGLFHLKNDTLSYLFQVSKYGQLQHVHFGAPVSTGDAYALTCRPGLGWGSFVVLEDSDPESCLDFLALEWSGSGRGDYRESPLELGGVSSDLRYVNYSILEGPAMMTCGLPQAHGDCETLEITLEQPGLRVKLYYTLFDTAITRRTVVEFEDWMVSDIPEPDLSDDALDTLADALLALKEKERDLIILHYYSGHTLKTVAEMMGMSYVNAKVIHKKALSRLQEEMKKLTNQLS